MYLITRLTLYVEVALYYLHIVSVQPETQMRYVLSTGPQNHFILS